MKKGYYLVTMPRNLGLYYVPDKLLYDLVIAAHPNAVKLSKSEARDAHLNDRAVLMTAKTEKLLRG